jgi:hypothetical protein
MVRVSSRQPTGCEVEMRSLASYRNLLIYTNLWIANGISYQYLVLFASGVSPCCKRCLVERNPNSSSMFNGLMVVHFNLIYRRTIKKYCEINCLLAQLALRHAELFLLRYPPVFLASAGFDFTLLRCPTILGILQSSVFHYLHRKIKSTLKYSGH